MAKYLTLFSLIIASIFSLPSQGATCSCAGVALSNSINLMGLEPGQYQARITYTNTDISDLVAGTEDVNDETGRTRETDSYIAQTTYGISEMWSVTGVVSWVEHRRNIAISNTNEEQSSGLGDSLVVVSYAPVKIDPFSRNEWALGLGIRLPTGEDNNGNPIIFAEDLQPGQGAWGISLWLHYGHVFSQKAEWLYFIDASISNTQSNEREYSFEDELNLTTGFSYTANSDWNTSFSLTYRNVDSHTRFGDEIPNTGGKWLDFSPSIQYAISPSTSISLAARIPVWRDLKGALQFTTKQSYSLSINYLIN